VVWTVAFCFSVYESPRDHPRITREETDYIRVAMGADAVDPDAAVSQQVFHARYDTLRYDTIRYEISCWFNVRAVAGISRLNLPHATNDEKVNENPDMPRSIGKHFRGIRGVSPGKEREGYDSKDLQKRKVLSLMPSVL